MENMESVTPAFIECLLKDINDIMNDTYELVDYPGLHEHVLRIASKQTKETLRRFGRMTKNDVIQLLTRELQIRNHLCSDPVCFCDKSLFVKTATTILEHHPGLEPLFYEWANKVMDINKTWKTKKEETEEKTEEE